MKIGSLWRNNFIGPCFCAGLIGFLLVLAACCPTAGVGVYADGPEDNIESVDASQDVADGEAGIMPLADDDPVIALELSSPTIGGDKGYVATAPGEPAFGAVTVTATATQVDASKGYSFVVQAAGGSSTENLVSSVDSLQVITPVSASTQGNAIPENRWGYAIEKGITSNYEGMTYKPVAPSGTPTTGDVAGTSDITGEQFTLAFGAHIGDGMPAGHYQTNVLVSLVVNTKALVTYNLTYDRNGADSGTVPASQTGQSRAGSYEFDVVGNTGSLAKANTNWLGWSEQNNCAAESCVISGGKLTVSATGADTVNKTIYAAWQNLYTYSITYDLDSGSWPDTGTYNQSVGPVADTSKQFTVTTTKPTKADYDFVNWKVTAGPGANSTTYNGGETITLQSSSPTITLTAQWQAKGPTVNGTFTQKFGGFTYMQDPAVITYCNSSSTPNGTTGQLADGRDGKIYWITKLADVCWMTQDLDFDLQNAVLTTENTGANLYKGSQTAWSVGNVESTSSGWTTNNYSTVNWYSRDDSHGTAHNSLGNLYSYQAATANTGSATTSDNTEVGGSICPAGWKLPLSGNSTANGSFESLKTKGGYDSFANMTSNTLANGAPYYFQYGGYISGSLNGVGTYGRYWSATSRNSNRAYHLYFATDGSFITASNYSRYYGYSVRCVVR